MQERIAALEEAKTGAEDARDEALRQVQQLQHELTHMQSTAAKHEREMLQVRPQDSIPQLAFTLKRSCQLLHNDWAEFTLVTQAYNWPSHC